ncbi:MAG: hypothetical protein R6W97_10635 [Thiobacillus sp.]
MAEKAREATARDGEQREQAEKVEREKQIALAEQAAKAAQLVSQQTAKERAAEALRKARASVGIKAFAE